MKTFRNPPNMHAPVAPYTHQIEISGPERLLVLAGQVGIRPDGTIPDDPIEQFEVAFENLRRNLQAANMDVQDVVKITFYLVGEIDTEQRIAVISNWLGDHRPCTTLLYVPALANPKYRVEIDAWASAPIRE